MGISLCVNFGVFGGFGRPGVPGRGVTIPFDLFGIFVDDDEEGSVCVASPFKLASWAKTEQFLSDTDGSQFNLSLRFERYL